MPSQYPPYSTARHSAIEARRMSREPSRDGGYRPQHQQYYAEEQRQSSRDGGYRPHHQQHHVEDQRQEVNRMKGIRGHFTAMLGEFVGTTMFLWFALAGTQSANTLGTVDGSEIGRVFYISLVFGLSLLVCAWAFYRISGGLFNPAVTIGMVTAGQMPFVRALFIFPAQVLGGIAAAALVSCMFPGPIRSTVTTLSDGVSITRGVFIEAFLTFILVFTILMLAAEKNNAKAVAPVGIGLSLFVAELAGVPYTGGALNPARSFGPSVVAPYFPGYHYIYWFGPIMGALAAAGYYRLCKALHYEEAQPGQDDNRTQAVRREKRDSQEQRRY